MNRTILVTVTLTFVIAALAVHLGCDRQQPSAESSPSTSPSTDASVKTITVSVDGMSCAACVASVRKNVTALDGVTGVEVSLEKRQAKVHYQEEKVSPARIAESIQKLGYKAGEPKVEAAQ